MQVEDDHMHLKMGIMFMYLTLFSDYIYIVWYVFIGVI